MDGPRFDAWTRRRFTLAAGGLVAAILGHGATSDTRADRRKHARLPKCGKVKARCSLKKKTRTPPCCDKINRLTCDRVGAPSGAFRCCYDAQQICSGAPGECCRDLKCGSISTLSGSRCCGSFGVACKTANDCCNAIDCINGVCNLPITCVADGQLCPGDCDPAGSCAGCCGGYCDGNVRCSPSV